jgi:two-component system response regulator RstA
MPIRALIIDDDARLAELLRAYLSPHDVLLAHAPDGPAGLRAVAEGGVDLVVLDVMMPGMDGLDVLRRLRERSGVPVIMLTARGDETDRVVGLELGADDYLAKPVRPRVLLARVRGLLRRRPESVEPAREVSVGGLVVDAGSRRAAVDGQAVELTTAEFDLLWFFACRVGEVVDRDRLYRGVRGVAWDGVDRSIDLRVSRLRRKIGAHRIKSVRGTGYLMVPAP